MECGVCTVLFFVAGLPFDEVVWGAIKKKTRLFQILQKDFIGLVVCHPAGYAARKTVFYQKVGGFVYSPCFKDALEVVNKHNIGGFMVYISVKVVKITNIGARIINMNTKVANLYAKVTNLYAKVTNLYAKVANLYAKVANLYANVANLYAKVTNLHARLTS